MEAPALVLVPSSPLEPTSTPGLSTKNSSPVSSDSSHTSRPPSAYGITIEDESRRNSSESTIFSIYSMYSERRQTWRKSALANSTLHGVGLMKQPRDESRESGADGYTDEGRPSESIADSFFRASNTMSRQSSSGSGFFAGSVEGSSRYQSYHHSPSQSPHHSRPASRHVVGGFVEASSRPGSTELPYADGDSLPNYGASLPAPTIVADYQPSTISRTRSGPAVASQQKYVDLTLGDDGQADLTMHRQSPGSGKVHDVPVPSTVEPDEPWHTPTRPPRVSPHTSQAHAKSESSSTTGTGSHFGLGISPSGSVHGVDAMSTTHEGYVTAPQSVESSGSYSTPVLRFRVANPSPSPSPSPPPLLHHTSLPSSPSLKRPASGPRPLTSSPALTHAKQPSVVSSPPPGRTSTATSSSRGSRVRVPGEDPEAFFVRNTYAQLDVTGVKGDGYEEGVERTRAKLGHDRRSVQLAVRDDAKGDVTGDVPEEELEILSSVNRYGFISAPSNERVVMLSASLLSKPLQPVTHTNTSCVPTPPILSSVPEPPPVTKTKETKRALKWGRMLEAERRDSGGNVAVWRVKPGKERKLRKRVFKGIPDTWRAAAWEVLIARWVGNHKKESLDATRLENMLNDLRREYRSSLDRPSSYDVQIDLDVPRTINGHVLFKTRYGQGQCSLFHTLHSFSLVCEECGYCQGMGPLAATLLCYYEPEKVYSSLVHFHDEYRLHDIFLPGFPGLLEAIYVQERIMERMLPTVYASFKKHMISTTSYATKWYITMFANTVPFQTQLRLWDAFLLEGRDVCVIVAVAIVWALRDHLTSNQASFETVLSLLSSFFVPEDEDALLRWIDRALADKKLRGDMTRWRTEWRGLVAEKKEASVLL